MNSLYFAVALYILIQISNGTLTKYLINQHIPGSVVLFFRAGFCLLFVLALALIKNDSLVPKKPKIQGMRIVLAGVGLFLITNSYAYLNATSVAFVQRLDMLIVMIISCVLAGKWFSTKNAITIITLVAAVSFIAVFKNATESMQGIIMVLAGTSCVVTGYFLIKSVVEHENELVITGVACIGSMLVCSIDIIARGTHVLPLTNNLLWLAFIAEGTFMLLLYLLTVRLYKVMSVEHAQFIALVASFLTIPFEYYFAGSQFTWGYIIGLFTMILIVSATLFYFEKAKEK